MAGRRMARDPDKDRWKQAIKLPKAAKPKKVGAPVPIGSSVWFGVKVSWACCAESGVSATRAIFILPPKSLGVCFAFS